MPLEASGACNDKAYSFKVSISHPAALRSMLRCRINGRICHRSWDRERDLSKCKSKHHDKHTGIGSSSLPIQFIDWCSISWILKKSPLPIKQGCWYHAIIIDSPMCTVYFLPCTSARGGKCLLVVTHAHGILGLVHDAATSATVNLLVLGAAKLVADFLRGGLAVVGLGAASGDVSALRMEMDEAIFTEPSCRWCRLHPPSSSAWWTWKSRGSCPPSSL